MENNKKKKTVAAVAVAAAVLLTGTYAWQSISQEAVNIASGEINPGGRLHDDFNGSTKRIYVENFASDDIYARIKLDEYFEIGLEAGQNLGTEGRNVEIITAGASYDDRATWQTHLLEGNTTDDYWTWEMEGAGVSYMPTFNMNKDSLKADINGTYAGASGTGAENPSERYTDFVDYDNPENASIEGVEVRDNDTNDIEDEGITETPNTHTVQTTLDSCVISMADWDGLTDEVKETTECWVYDADGWAYWSKPIAGGTATGTILRSIELDNVDDNWYYEIVATAQFITADDLGKDDNTGFYDLDKGTAPSDNALELLKDIGVEVEEDVVQITTTAAQNLMNSIGTSGLESVTHTANNTLQIGTTEDITEYRFKGGNDVVTNNYVYFNCSNITNQTENTCELYRIIGVFPVDDGTGNIEERVKLIRAESYELNNWNGNGNNNWASPATLNTYFNETYWGTINKDYQALVGDAKYYLGGYSGNPEIFANEMYENERKIEGRYYYYPGNPTNWTGKIGLMYASDYGYAASRTCSENSNLYYYDSDTCDNTNWLFLGENEWTLTQETSDSESVYRIGSPGYVSGNANVITGSDYVVRQVFYLTADAEFSDVGDGSASNPYQLIK